MTKTKYIHKESEEIFSSIVNVLSDLIFIIDKDGIITYQNPAVQRILGYSPKEIIGKHILDFMHSEDITNAKNLIDQTLNSKENTLPVNIRFCKKDGNYIWMESSGINMIEKTSINGIIILGRYVSLQPVAERSLRDNEEMLRNVLQTVPDLIIRTDLNANIIFINDSSIPFLRNYPKEKLLGKNLRSFIVPEDQERAEINLKKMFESHLGVQEYKIKFNAGSSFICEINGDVIRNHNKQPIEMVFVIRDITERKVAEEIIKSNEAFINNLLRTLPIPVFYKDKEGRYINVNDAFLSLFGNKKEQFIGKTVFDLYPTDLAKTYFEKDIELLKSGGTQVYESIFHDANGKNHNAIFHKATFEDHEHKIAGLIGAILDITEQKLIEENTKASKERWQNLFDNSPNPIAIYKAVDNGNDFEFTEFNPKAQKMSYNNRDEVIGKRITELFPGVKKNGLLEVMTRVWQTGKTEFIKSSFYVDNFIENWLENLIYKLTTEEIVVIYIDVTENVIAQKALKENEEKFRTIFENANDSILILGMHKVMDCNLRTLEMFGCSKEQLIESAPNKLSPPNQPDGRDSREKAYEKIKLVLSGIPQRFEWQYLKYDGPPFDADVSFDKLELHGQTFIQAIIRDITEKKKNEGELQKYREHLEVLVETRTEELDHLNADLIAQLQREKELKMMLKYSLDKEKELNELKSRFISTASHEFRTPLTTIYSSVQLLEKYGKTWNAVYCPQKSKTKKQNKKGRIIKRHILSYLSFQNQQGLNIPKQNGDIFGYKKQ